jgi:hypothetical protein
LSGIFHLHINLYFLQNHVDINKVRQLSTILIMIYFIVHMILMQG